MKDQPRRSRRLAERIGKENVSPPRRTRAAKRRPVKRAKSPEVEVCIDATPPATVALASNLTGTMPGREPEIEAIGAFIRDSVAGKTTGGLYLTGPPGTGKTSAVELVARRLEHELDFAFSLVTCVNLGPKDVASAVAEALGVDAAAVERAINASGLDAAARMINAKKSPRRAVLVLDELDGLACRGPASIIASRLFELAGLTGLTLIGIANSIDFLSHTSAYTIVFRAYDTSTLLSIVTTRLAAAAPAGVDARAVELCVRRVASKFGDCRIALDAVKKLVQEQSGANSSSDTAAACEILSRVCKTEDARTTDFLRTAPLQQQLMACAAAKLAVPVMELAAWQAELAAMASFTRLSYDPLAFDLHLSQLVANGLVTLTRTTKKRPAKYTFVPSPSDFSRAASRHSKLFESYFQSDSV